MSIRILLVDDFDPFRHYVRALLQDEAPFAVITEVCDGVAAVQKAAELQPDIILLDISLPLLSGIEAAQQIGVLSPGSRMLFISQQTSPELICETFRRGAWAYLIKTHVASELLPALKAVQNGTMYLSRYSAHEHKSVRASHPAVR
jgi:DNA-binding NarL/FixJ family response regulator